ncbi:MAG: DUF4825 domain-containing protein [Dorea sp.]
MKNRLPCELIRDLLPSYVEKLTSDVTNHLIEEHLTECEECRSVLKSMKEPVEEPIDTEESQELDFLKKTRKKTRRVILGISMVIIVVAAALWIAKDYVIGTQVSSEYVACDVEVEDNILNISGRMVDEKLDISKVQFCEEDGVIIISFRSVRNSPIYENKYEEKYIACDKITEVRVDDRIIWSNGRCISAMTSSVYHTRHPYVGDMPANGNTVSALNLVGQFGNFTNDLQTEEVPYEWKMIFADPFPEHIKAGAGEELEAYAYVILAVIDNLDRVTYEYTADGEAYELTVTSEDASAYAGQDIKEIGADIVLLQQLMEKTGLVGD